jgi:hypothetical protein
MSNDELMRTIEQAVVTATADRQRLILKHEIDDMTKQVWWTIEHGLHDIHLEQKHPISFERATDVAAMIAEAARIILTRELIGERK